MIERPTTLILGAGASAPFGFPTGYELFRQVLSWANIKPGGTNPLYFRDFKEIEIDNFRNALSKSGKSSVDAFLEHRPEFISVGKTAMAIALTRFENEEALFKRDGKSWYEYLFNQLNTKFEDFDKNKLSILTFNYDRSLEHYLFTSLRNAYGAPEAQCAAKLKSIPIIHLHGDLGQLPFMGTEQMNPYTDELSESKMLVATQRIKIIHEGTQNEPQFALAKKILSESATIIFLGFGYHPLNMERLGFKIVESRASSHQGNIGGTSFGLTDNECRQIGFDYGLDLKSAYTNFRLYDVLKYLRETVDLRGK